MAIEDAGTHAHREILRFIPGAAGCPHSRRVAVGGTEEPSVYKVRLPSTLSLSLIAGHFVKDEGAVEVHQCLRVTRVTLCPCRTRAKQELRHQRVTLTYGNRNEARAHFTSQFGSAEALEASTAMPPRATKKRMMRMSPGSVCLSLVLVRERS